MHILNSIQQIQFKEGKILPNDIDKRCLIESRRDGCKGLIPRPVLFFKARVGNLEKPANVS